jgi:carboxyl-terminal processing protease
VKILIIIFITCISYTSTGQSETQRDYLVCYGQIWGFLKYFHPEPSNQDWDKTLLEDFDKIKNCSSDSEFNLIISTLINDCGSFTPKNRIISDSLTFEESYEWLERSLISDENKKTLIHLLQNKPYFKNKYIAKTTVGNPKIINEIDYGTYSCSPSLQFLALTRYWNVINYFCPNRDIIPRDWTTVYKDHVSNFIDATSYEDYYFAVCKITSEIRDGHGFIKTDNNPMNDYKYAPFYCVNVSDGYYITFVWQDSLDSYNLKKMDRIISIDGISVEEKIKQIGTIISTSNDYDLSKSTYYLRLFDTDSVSITIEREGVLIREVVPTIDKATLTKRYIPSKTTNTPRPYGFFTDSISGKKYCFIDMGKLKRSDITGKFKRNLYGTEQIIIDSRNYPNWTLIELTKVLIKGKRKFAHFKKMNFDYPGSFEWTQSQTIGNKRKGYDGDVYVLVDYNTMSQAEYTVMALQQHPNTIVIGGQTAGADGNISEIPLPFGIKSVFSGLGVFYPDRTPTQQVGVRRDHQIVQNKSFIEERRDLILEKALELIRQNNACNTQ